MNSEGSGKRNYGDPADVMLLLVKEADDLISLAGKSARQEAGEETERLLIQYEQKAKQIVLKIREETRARADEMAARFRDALILRVEEASTVALDETLKSVGIKADEIVKHLQEGVRKETRQALAEGLIAGDDQSNLSRICREEEKPEAKAEQPAIEPVSLVSDGGNLAPKTPEDFESWLLQ